MAGGKTPTPLIDFYLDRCYNLFPMVERSHRFNVKERLHKIKETSQLKRATKQLIEVAMSRLEQEGRVLDRFRYLELENKEEQTRYRLSDDIMSLAIARSYSAKRRKPSLSIRIFQFGLTRDEYDGGISLNLPIKPSLVRRKMTQNLARTNQAVTEGGVLFINDLTHAIAASKVQPVRF